MFYILIGCVVIGILLLILSISVSFYKLEEKFFNLNAEVEYIKFLIKTLQKQEKQ